MDFYLLKDKNSYNVLNKFVEVVDGIVNVLFNVF